MMFRVPAAVLVMAGLMLWGSVQAGPARPGQEPEYVEWRGEAEFLMRKPGEMKSGERSG